MLDDYEWLFSWLWEQKQIATGGSSVLTRATQLFAAESAKWISRTGGSASYRSLRSRRCD